MGTAADKLLLSNLPAPLTSFVFEFLVFFVGFVGVFVSVVEVCVFVVGFGLIVVVFRETLRRSVGGVSVSLQERIGDGIVNAHKALLENQIHDSAFGGATCNVGAALGTGRDTGGAALLTDW